MAPDLDTERPTDVFAQFVRPHWAVMARLAQRLAGTDWEDVLQDALAQAWRTRSSFDPDRGSERTWLLVLVADRARKTHRRNRPHLELLDDLAEPPAERDLDLERAVRSLPERQRVAVELFYFLDLPVADIAAVMSCAPGTVKSTLSDARANLRARLGGERP